MTQTDARPEPARESPGEAEHLDVLIIGAGLSGVGAAAHLVDAFPGRSYALLEMREAIGGTWDLFRYPGVRSDSDMFTLGYSFEPWTGDQVLADGPSIKAYVEQTARDRGITDHVRFGHKVTRAEWSSEQARWAVTVEHGGEEHVLTCDLLWGCSGYYRYDRGHHPELPGQERYAGTLAYPQFWPEDLDWAGKKVVVVGSGATAITLVPAMAEEAAHVTMLQRSPTYVMSLPATDTVAPLLRRALPDGVAHSVTRWQRILQQLAFYQFCRRFPGAARRLIRAQARKQLGDAVDVDTHFKPAYDPWDQRLCVVPDGDLFRALRRGEASVVTDTIDTFTETGIRTSSGEELEADVVVPATGIVVEPLADIDVVVDGEKVDLGERMAYKAMLLDGVPNFAFVFGYTNASWTLKADLVSAYVVRLLRHMDAHGHRVFEVPRDESVEPRPFSDFSSNYFVRALPGLPQQGDRKPWSLAQNYLLDRRTILGGPVDDGVIRFS